MPVREGDSELHTPSFAKDIVPQMSTLWLLNCVLVMRNFNVFFDGYVGVGCPWFPRASERVLPSRLPGSMFYFNGSTFPVAWAHASGCPGAHLWLDNDNR